MSWRRLRSSGLIVPSDQKRTLDAATPLAQGLASLWLPNEKAPGTGLVNLASPLGPQAVYGGSAPVLQSTALGPGLTFNGFSGYALRQGSIPFVPNNNFASTIAIVCRVNALTTQANTLYSFSNDPGFATLELDAGTTETKMVYTGDGNTTQTYSIISNPITAGSVVFLCGVLDSFTTSRLSLWEPETGVFRSATNTTGTTNSAATANGFDYENIANWYYNPGPGYYTDITLLDAWFWQRALSEDEIALWRRDRWSVLQSDRRRVFDLGTVVASANAAAGQTIAPITQVATAQAGGGLRQTATLAAFTQTATLTRRTTAQQASLIPAPTQTTVVRALAQAQQARTISAFTNVALAQAAVGTTTFDRTTTQFSTTTVTMDGGGLAILSADATQTLAAFSRTATATVRAAASATQAVPAFTQTAAGTAVAPALATLSTVQTLLLPTQTAVLANRVTAVAAGQIPAPSQVAQAAGPVVAVTRLAQAIQTLESFAHTATAIAVLLPIEPPPPLPPVLPVEAPLPTPVLGGLEDMIDRQIQVMPPWFGPPGIIPPILRLPLLMAGSVGVWLYDLIAYARLQTRIATATEGWLDLIGLDFFGRRILRRAGQSDTSYRARIKVELFRPRATRPAMISVLEDLTGKTPRIFEPQRPQDVGGIGIDGHMGIGIAGAIGSLTLPGEIFIDVYRDPEAGIPYAAGIGMPQGGIGVPSRLVIGNLDLIRGALTEADVYSVIEATRPVGIRVWVRLLQAGGSTSFGGPTPGATPTPTPTPVPTPVPTPTPVPDRVTELPPIPTPTPTPPPLQIIRQAAAAQTLPNFTRTATGVAVPAQVFPTSPHLRIESINGGLVVQSQNGRVANIRFVRPLYPVVSLANVVAYNSAATVDNLYFGGHPSAIIGAQNYQLAVPREIVSSDDGTYPTFTIYRNMSDGSTLTLDVNLSVAESISTVNPVATPVPALPQIFFEDFAPDRGTGALYKTWRPQQIINTPQGTLYLEPSTRTDFPDGTFDTPGCSCMTMVSATNDGTRGFGNGLFEFRAKFFGATVGDRSGPAIILWPADDRWTTEIDLGEIDWRGQLYLAVHYVEPATGQGTGADLYGLGPNHDYTQWHTYAAFLQTDRVTLYVDGVVVGANTAHPAPDYAHGGVNHTVGLQNGSSNTSLECDWIRWTPERLVVPS